MLQFEFDIFFLEIELKWIESEKYFISLVGG